MGLWPFGRTKANVETTARVVVLRARDAVALRAKVTVKFEEPQTQAVADEVLELCQDVLRAVVREAPTAAAVLGFESALVQEVKGRLPAEPAAVRTIEIAGLHIVGDPGHLAQRSAGGDPDPAWLHAAPSSSNPSPSDMPPGGDRLTPVQPLPAAKPIAPERPGDRSTPVHTLPPVKGIVDRPTPGREPQQPRGIGVERPAQAAPQAPAQVAAPAPAAGPPDDVAALRAARERDPFAATVQSPQMGLRPASIAPVAVVVAGSSPPMTSASNAPPATSILSAPPATSTSSAPPTTSTLRPPADEITSAPSSGVSSPPPAEIANASPAKDRSSSIPPEAASTAAANSLESAPTQPKPVEASATHTANATHTTNATQPANAAQAANATQTASATHTANATQTASPAHTANATHTANAKQDAAPRALAGLPPGQRPGRVPIGQPAIPRQEPEAPPKPAHEKHEKAEKRDKPGQPRVRAVNPERPGAYSGVLPDSTPAMAAVRPVSHPREPFATSVGRADGAALHGRANLGRAPSAPPPPGALRPADEPSSSTRGPRSVPPSSNARAGRSGDEPSSTSRNYLARSSDEPSSASRNYLARTGDEPSSSRSFGLFGPQSSGPRSVRSASNRPPPAAVAARRRVVASRFPLPTGAGPYEVARGLTPLFRDTSGRVLVAFLRTYDLTVVRRVPFEGVESDILSSLTAPVDGPPGTYTASHAVEIQRWRDAFGAAKLDLLQREANLAAAALAHEMFTVEGVPTSMTSAVVEGLAGSAFGDPEMILDLGRYMFPARESMSAEVLASMLEVAKEEMPEGLEGALDPLFASLRDEIAAAAELAREVMLTPA